MKFNLKYAMIACAALMAGFTSCSNDDENGLNSGDGEEMGVRFSLVQKSTNTRAADAAPTIAEREVYTAKLFIFNNNQVLEKVVDFPSGEKVSKPVDIKSGLHHFLVAVNRDVTMTEGTTTLAEGKKIIRNLADMADVVSATSPGYFMTTLEDHTENLMPATNPSADPITVTIGVGRAMAKVNMVLKNGANELTGPQGNLTNVKYLTANNPREMYSFPVIETGIYKAPYYAVDVDEWMSPADQNAKYFPFIQFADDYSTISTQSVAPGTPAYIIENANKTPRKHNAAYLLVSGNFIPATWHNATGESIAAPSTLPATFYRLYNVNNDEYYDFYIQANNEVEIALEKFAKTDVDKGHIIRPIRYRDGECYYAFYLANQDIESGNSVFTVKRNTYYDVTLNQVLSAGASVPNIEGNAGGEDEDGNPITDPNEYVPGTGGGDGGGNNPGDGGGTDPIDGESKIKGEVEIIDWAVVGQEGPIGF